MPFSEDNNNDLPGNDPQTIETNTPAPAEESSTPAAVETAADAITAPASNDDLPTDKPQSDSIKALLETISEGTQAPKLVEETPAETPPEDKPADTPPAEPATPEQEEAELLDVVKSERGKERIRQVLAERKALEGDLKEIRELIGSTKMNPDQFSQTLEYGRLINSNEEKDLRVALEMVDRERALLCQRLGIEQPGVDLLAGHDDLKAAVDNLEITRDKAVELAKYRKQQADQVQRQEQQQRSESDRQAFQQTVTKAATTMEAYLETRANEADHPAKMQMIANHFNNPANLQEFVSTYQPDQWLATIKMMYDNIVVPRQAAPAAAPQPLRSRTAQLGTPAPTSSSPIDRIAAHMDNLGI